MSYVLPERVKKGDMVKANEFAEEFGLTPGKEYEILEHYGLEYKVKNDAGVEDIYSYEYFTR